MSAKKGLTPETFDAYTEDKWSSNVHNLPRMKAKEILLSVCDAAQADLQSELEGLTRASSDEIPNISNQKKVDAQWVFWLRDKKARENLASFLKELKLDGATMFNIAPHDKHAVLAVVLRQADVWVGLRIAPGAAVDRRNLAAKLGKSWEREKLMELLAELPPGAELGSADELTSTEQITVDNLGGIVEQLAENRPAWRLGHHMPAEEAVELGTDLADHIARWLGTLMPLYRFAAWSPDNDFIGAAKQIKEEKEQKRRQATSYEPGDPVRVINGLFSGKRGVVESVDTKAQVKVKVGNMSVVVSGHDLTPA